MKRYCKSLWVVAIMSSLSLAMMVSGCSNKPMAPIVSASHVEVLDSSKPSADPNSSFSQSVSVSVTVNKSAILNGEYLYGADLQYSSDYDKAEDLYTQSTAMGHIPARFRMVGNELQLIADNRILFPSDVNHPEQLLTRFQIQSQTATELTISDANSSVLLAEFFGGSSSDTEGLLTPATPAPRDRWTRSFEFVPQGNYLLQQTSVILADGTIAEFMESIFPRENLKPNPGFQKVQMDPSDPAGASQGIAARYRYLEGEKISHGDTELAFAQHPDLSPSADGKSGGTMEWYITPNVPDETLPTIKEAVEGWNRYFSIEKGVERNVMVFKGKLPEGIHLGDPRYNVINWDSRLVAGAAYESQATDPETGKQSHSLIYMPAAWLQIGQDYWKQGDVSDADPQPAASSTPTLGGSLAKTGRSRYGRIACSRDVRAGAALAVSGRLSVQEIKDFAHQLLKQTLFHEVGHSLGLAHNFKGSLSFDRSNPQSMFSTSIMDYNDFEIERAAFTSVDSADGPLLEYDRQAISALHNAGADVASTDETVPTCNDAEADNEDGGVDPLCIRYDIEKDPTLSVKTALNRVKETKMSGDVSLDDAIANVPSLALDDATVQGIKNKDDLDAAVEKLTAGLEGALKFYVTTGKASLKYVVRMNMKALLVYGDNVLPKGYDAQAMRERAFTGAQAAANLRQMPKATLAALAQAAVQSLKLLQAAPYMAQATEADSTSAEDAVTKAVIGSIENFEIDPKNGLPGLRASVLVGMARHPAVPYFFGKDEDGKESDYEKSLIGILGDAAVDSTRTVVERVAASKALLTYTGRASGDPAIKAVRAKIQSQRVAATDNDAREAAETLATILK